MSNLPGGVGAEHDITDDVAALVIGLKEAIEAKAGATYATFKPVKYASQVVAGTNYFVKVDVGDGHYIHVRIFKPLPHTGEAATVHSVQTGKASADAIAHF